MKIKNNLSNRMVEGVDWLARLQAVSGWLAPTLPALAVFLAGLGSVLGRVGLAVGVIYSLFALLLALLASFVGVQLVDYLHGRRPRVQLVEDDHHTGSFFTRDGSYHGLFVRFPIVNMGLATSLSDWRAWLRPAGGGEVAAVINRGDLRLGDRVIHSKDQHPSFEDESLDTGGRRTATVVVIAPASIRRSDLERLGTQVRISCRDHFGRESSGLFTGITRIPENSDTALIFQTKQAGA